MVDGRGLTVTARLGMVTGGSTMWNYVWCTLTCLLYIQHGCRSEDDFGYSREEQQLWSRHSSSCAGKFQSPIRLSSGRATELPIPALEMVGFHDPLPAPVTATNTGHSVSLRPSAGNHSSSPLVFGALLSSQYRLESLHFHWGHKNSRGSEHVLNDIRFPMEMHMVHRNVKYETLGEALHNKDGLVVLGFFLQARERSNRALRPILEVLEEVKNPGETAVLSSKLTLASIVSQGDTDTFYTYRGSLTTPPCSEAVTWIIFPDALPISFNQIKKFRQVYSGAKHMEDNFRLPQSLNSRKVFVRRPWSTRTNDTVASDLDELKRP